MKNEEIKKKIVEILCKVWIETVPFTAERKFEHAADALIAAGIGDVSGLKNHRLIAEYSLIPEDGNSYVLPNTPLRVKQLYSGEEVERIAKERDEYKHRAEVAERAARDLIAYYCSYTIQSDIDSGLRVALQQAEKELEGEKPIKTSDLSQCQSCAYHYTYEGQDMCRQVGDDFYLQWKMEDCPKYSFIGDVLCSEPVYQLKHELRSKIEYIHEQDEVIKEYKHRAARAERALQIADELGELCGRKEDYVQQAEKELQEEKKSD